MLHFLRSDLAHFQAYTPHPGGAGDSHHAVAPAILDRLDTNESPFDLPEDLKQKLNWAYQETIESNRYPDGNHDSLKQAIAAYVNESAGGQADIAAAQISVGNGSDELIRSLLIATCLRGEGSVLVAEPTFSMYRILAETLGIPVVPIGRSPHNFELDLVAAQQAITQTQQPPIRVVFVVHPNSPTANALTAAELDWLRSLPEHILVVIDEAYFEFSQTTVVPELAQHPNWVVLRTFSKAFRLAAHRVGYAIAHPELTATLEKVRLPYNVPSLSQTAAHLALQYRSQLLDAIPLILSERARLLTALAQEPRLQVWPSAANFVFARLRSAESLDNPDALLTQLCQTLKAEGTLLRQVSQGLRITIGTVEENTRTIERLHRALPVIAC